MANVNVDDDPEAGLDGDTSIDAVLGSPSHEDYEDPIAELLPKEECAEEGETVEPASSDAIPLPPVSSLQQSSDDRLADRAQPPNSRSQGLHRKRNRDDPVVEQHEKRTKSTLLSSSSSSSLRPKLRDRNGDYRNRRPDPRDRRDLPLRQRSRERKDTRNERERDRGLAYPPLIPMPPPFTGPPISGPPTPREYRDGRDRRNFDGFIFECSRDTFDECMRLGIFGAPRKLLRDVEHITSYQTPLFLYHLSDKQLYGVFEATSRGAENINPTAWLKPGQRGPSPFPAQVSFRLKFRFHPLPDSHFRSVIPFGRNNKPSSRLDREQVKKLIALFAENDAAMARKAVDQLIGYFHLR